MPIQLATELAVDYTKLTLQLILLGSIPLITLFAWVTKLAYDTSKIVCDIHKDYTPIHEHNHLKDKHEELKHTTVTFIDKQDKLGDKIISLLNEISIK